MTQQLVECAESIDGRQLLAVRVYQNDTSFYLARAMGKAFIADEKIVHSTDEFEEVGFL